MRPVKNAGFKYASLDLGGYVMGSLNRGAWKGIGETMEDLTQLQNGSDIRGDSRYQGLKESIQTFRRMKPQKLHADFCFG